ncbi:hypothetical protein EVAR_76841_1 [Eumeta japonica]|uniref:Uncharacterized protein n=1 Tax=Eumeta variegata TaxID=151549 RepID=A0A4C1YVC0_EUMVA|nr:hypothetical protein EVAR_76841_1 [Eumeta japonica]
MIVLGEIRLTGRVTGPSFSCPTPPYTFRSTEIVIEPFLSEGSPLTLAGLARDEGIAPESPSWSRAC